MSDESLLDPLLKKDKPSETEMDLAKEVLDKMDMGVLGPAIQTFADTFSSMSADVASVKDRMNALLNNQKLTYALLIEVNERLKGQSAQRSAADTEERVRIARKAAGV